MASTGAPAARSHLWLERSKAVACSPRATTTSCSTTAVCFASSVPVFLLTARSQSRRTLLPAIAASPNETSAPARPRGNAEQHNGVDSGRQPTVSRGYGRFHREDPRHGFQICARPIPASDVRSLGCLSRHFAVQGLYTDIGEHACHSPFVGSFPHYRSDAETFADWKVDYGAHPSCC